MKHAHTSTYEACEGVWYKMGIQFAAYLLHLYNHHRSQDIDIFIIPESFLLPFSVFCPSHVLCSHCYYSILRGKKGIFYIIYMVWYTVRGTAIITHFILFPSSILWIVGQYQSHHLSVLKLQISCLCLPCLPVPTES